MSANLADLRILLIDFKQLGEQVATALRSEGPGGTKDVLELVQIDVLHSYELLLDEVKIHERAARQMWLNAQDVQP